MRIGGAHRSRLVVAAVFAVAAVAAAAFALAPALIRAGASSADSPSTDDARPALRLADRAGLVTVGLAARPDGHRIRLLYPEVDLPAPVVSRATMRDGDGSVTELALTGCGADCVEARTATEDGPVRLAVEVTFGGRTETAVFRFPWPASPDRRAMLERAVRRTAAIGEVSAVELVTSDPARGYYRNPERTVSGRTLADLYAVAGARDVRQLPAVDGRTRLAYELPMVPAWIEVDIAPGGHIVRDRFVTQNRLWTQTITPRTPPRAGPADAPGGG